MKQTLIAFLLFTGSFAFAQKKLIPTDTGSKIHFTIKNFGINTGGDFTGMKGTIVFDAAKPATAAFDVSVEAKTVDTDNDSRDGHLRTDDYFDVVKFPEIKLVSTKVEATSKANTYMFTGNLIIKGVSKPQHFLFTALPKDGGYVFAADFEINRRDFNVGGNSAVLSDNVKISITAFAK